MPKTRIIKPRKKKRTAKVKAGAIPPEELVQPFPSIELPIQPPYPPAEAKSVNEIPRSTGWLYEPKWDGFRCLAFRNGKGVLLQSKAGQPLGRYFPELVAALSELPERRFVLDGEIVIFSGGHLSFDDLLLRIHPAESRIRKLSAESPASFMCFDLLVDSKGQVLTDLPLKQRREKLVQLFRHFPAKGTVRLSPASTDPKQAEQWMRELATLGLDGIVAKRLDEPYRSGERTGMVKIKRIRTADADNFNNRYMFEINSRWTIDGSGRRNIARYINHSCRPNAETDVKKQKIIVTATKHIEPGAEITYNYGRAYFNAFIKPNGCKCEACKKKRIRIRS